MTLERQQTQTVRIIKKNVVRRYGILSYGNKVESKEDRVDSLRVSDRLGSQFRKS